MLGLGVYTYNIYPVAVIAFVLFVAILTFVRYRGAEWRWWRGSALLMFGIALAVASPMIVYVARPSSYYWSHINNYSEVSVTQTQEYKDANATGKARLIGEQLETFGRAYAWHGNEDIIDATGVRAMFDWSTLLLLAGGLVIAARRRREPMVIAALCCLFVIPLPALTQQGSITRQPLGAAPFAMFIAALPLAAVWRASWERRGSLRTALRTIVVGLVAVVAVITVHDYFWTWRTSPLVRYVYHAEITAASEYVAKLPAGTYVYFYSDRHPFSLETRQFLAPGAIGIDRSAEFSNAHGSIAIDRPGRVVFVLLGTYEGILQSLQERYPGGRTVYGRHDGVLEFIAFEPPL